ncbi:isochorismatase family protein [Neorhizobium sp. DAR64872/K0K18]|uniref:isochorismatase family protein n=1 Tax=Neorhizobium sp. DAR64872/K0K18 TaxID=3421958 RepID=UPI003D266F31
MGQALVIIDMQMLMQHRLDAARDHVNGDTPAKIALLTAQFRKEGGTIIHVRHGEPDPASAMYLGAPDQQVMPCAEALDGEPIFIKSTSSPFASTEMEKYLRDNGIGTLVVTGAVAGFCVNTTVRAGSDLGFEMIIVRDAVLGFDMLDEQLSARTIFDVTMAHLKSDFAVLLDTHEILEAR